MSITIQVFDKTIPIIDKMLEVNFGVARESLSVSGDIIRKNARNVMRRKTNNWYTLYVNGRRTIKKLNMSKELGLRIAKGGSIDNPSSLSSMITSYIGGNSLTVVVGGKHRSANITKFKDGKADGTIFIKGVGVKTHSIIHKLNFGERNEHHTWNGKKESMKRFKNAKYVGYHFMEAGYIESKSYISYAMGEKYKSLFNKAVSSITVKVVKVS